MYIAYMLSPLTEVTTKGLFWLCTNTILFYIMDLYILGFWYEREGWRERGVYVERGPEISFSWI